MIRVSKHNSLLPIYVLLSLHQTNDAQKYIIRSHANSGETSGTHHEQVTNHTRVSVSELYIAMYTEYVLRHSVCLCLSLNTASNVCITHR